MNKFESFIPLMSRKEFEFIEKYLNKDDILLEWGSGNSTIYYSGIVKKVISIEHDIDYYNQLKSAIDVYNIKNIESYYIPQNSLSGKRYDMFKDYINFPIENSFKFTKVLIDGRGRKYCAKVLKNYMDKDTIVFIHDFNHNNVEGYEDKDYFNDILSDYNIIDKEIDTNQGIAALKLKT